MTQKHSGFQALDNIDMNGNQLQNVDSNKTVRAYVPFRANTGYTYTTDTNYVYKAAMLTFDKHKYPNLQSIKFCAHLRTENATATAYLRLANKTDNVHYPDSELTSIVTSDYDVDGWKESADIKADLPSGEKIYIVTIKTSNGTYQARLNNCMFIIEYKVVA